MNIKQARRLALLFAQATPPKPMYWEEGEPVPTVHITTKYEGDDVAIDYMLCPERMLVTFPSHLYITPEGALVEYDDETDGTRPVGLKWAYLADGEVDTWVLRTVPVAAEVTA